MYSQLINCSVFSGLNEKEIEHLFGTIHHFTKTYGVGEMIALSGEPCNYLICLLEGSVKAEMVDFSGKIIKLEDIQAPDALATAFLFGKNNHFPVNIMANEKAVLLYIPRYDFLKLLQSNIMLLQNFLGSISTRAQFLSDKIKFLSFKTIKGKIAQYILKLAGRDKDSIELPIKQQALAELFGVTRPAFARALGELAEAGIINVERRTIVILDRKRLIQLMK